MRESAAQEAKKRLAQLGLFIRSTNETSKAAIRGYISAKKTISAAQRDGLSVCDYLEKIWGQAGETQRVIDQMVSCGAFEAESLSILEIGTGTGRYLDKVFAVCKPNKYESYETAPDWAKWLESKYPIVSQKADGVSLQQTPDCSVDLLHAHGVFTYLPFLVSYGYWREIWRVMKNTGMVVFDIFSEACLDEPTLEKWFSTGANYPCFLSKDFVVGLFRKHGFSLCKDFAAKYGAGESEYLVFVCNNAPI